MLLIITFCFIVLIQVFFYSVVFGKFLFSKNKNFTPNLQPVSLIICSKNEEENLKNFLPEFTQQKYPLFEIVLVDDASTDASLQIMLDFKKKHTSNNLQIQIISIDENSSKGKKAALSLGIKSSKFDHLLLTDADCKPISDEWMSEMSSYFSKEKTIVLGYGAYRKIEKSFLNKIIRFETLLTAIQYFSYAKSGNAYMGVGRNIAYHKNEFINANGFNNHLSLLSGDDDLFVNQIANKENTEICIKKNSFTISEPKSNFKEWLDQKRRHITTASHYKLFHKFSLGLFYLSQILFWILGVVLLILQLNVSLVLLLMASRLIIWYIIIYKSTVRLNEKDLIGFAPIYEISIIFIQFYIFIKNIITPPKHW